MPQKYAPILFGLLLSGLMSFVVSGIATFRALGLNETFFVDWIQSWISSWLVAFPTVLVVAPLVRKMVARITQD